MRPLYDQNAFPLKINIAVFLVVTLYNLVDVKA
jgi:hypothetical protein